MINPLRIIRNPVCWYNLARWFYEKHIPCIPRMLDYFIRFCFGCWLPHSAKIGKALELGYGGLGCVFNSKCVIGDNVHVGTCVTIGGNARKIGRPTIGNNVFIGPGARILGEISIGDGSVIGANSVVIKDVPPCTVVAGVPARVIHENINIKEYLHESLFKDKS